MLKRLSCVLLIIFCFLFLGCQQPPNNEILTEKNFNQMLNKANISHETNNSVSLRLNIPEHYIESFSGDNINVNVNASIIVPDVNQIPIIKISGATFSQKVTDTLVDAFFNGNRLYTFDSLSLETKDDIISKLTQYMSRKAEFEQSGMKPTLPKDFNNDNNTSEENEKEDSYESGNELDGVITMIEIYERKLKEAPVEKELIESIGQLESFSLSGNQPEAESDLLLESLNLGLINSNGNCERLKIINNEAYNFYTTVYVNRNDYFGAGIYFSEKEWEQSEQTLSSADTLEEPLLSEDEAKKIADDFLKEVGIYYLNCERIDNVVGITGVYDSSGVELGERIKGYRLQYVRIINSVPITYTSREETYNEYSNSWYYERMTFIINDRGIVEMDWYSPYTLMDTIVDSTNMMAFKDIKRIFEKWILIRQEDEISGHQEQYSAVAQKREIYITETRLGLMRIMEPDNHNSGYLIPVWDFFGTATYYHNGNGKSVSSIDYNPFKSYLTINAIDGSIIDRGLGY